MTSQAWLGLTLGVLIGVAYGALQRWGMGKGPEPFAVGRSFAGSAIRLLVLVLAVFAVVQFTSADRVFLVVGIMVSYGIMFVATMWKVLWKKNGKS